MSRLIPSVSYSSVMTGAEQFQNVKLIIILSFIVSQKDRFTYHRYETGSF